MVAIDLLIFPICILYILCFSVQGLYPVKGTGFYTVSKAALDMVTKQFALELGPHQIRVNAVSPGLVSTYGAKGMPGYTELANALRALSPLGRICSEMDCVYPIMYLLSDKASMVTGGIHVIDGGCQLAILPK